jgi:hypothetical protein
MTAASCKFPRSGRRRTVEILISVVADYAWRPGVVTTDDWRIEILAPRPWIDQQIESMLSLSESQRDSVRGERRSPTEILAVRRRRRAGS